MSIISLIISLLFYILLFFIFRPLKESTIYQYFIVLFYPKKEIKKGTQLEFLLILFCLFLIYATTSFTRSAASCKVMAERTFSPESSIIFLAISAFVPCKRTIIGT